MRERKIDLRPNEVRGIIDGLQSQIRRVIKPQPTHFVGGTLMSRAECEKPLLRWTKGLPYKPTLKKPTKNGQVWEEDNGECFEPIECPYGKPDDRLWVRETWGLQGSRVVYRADGGQELRLGDLKRSWKPSIFMPRSVSRITLEITDIRCERLNDISEGDAIAEGIEVIAGKIDDSPTFKNYLEPGADNGFGYPQNSFNSLWQSINGPESWEANPFVWVITFRCIDK